MAAGGAEEGGAQQRYWQWPQGLDEKLLKVMADASGSPWGAGAQVSWMVRPPASLTCARRTTMYPINHTKLPLLVLLRPSSASHVL